MNLGTVGVSPCLSPNCHIFPDKISNMSLNSSGSLYRAAQHWYGWRASLVAGSGGFLSPGTARDLVGRKPPCPWHDARRIR